MTRTFIFLGVGAAWALLMAELVKREVLPYYEYQSPPSYRTVLESQPGPLLERWTIHAGPDVIGESETLFESEGDDGGRIRTRTIYDLRKTLPKELQNLPISYRVEAWSDVRVGPTYQLTSLRTTMKNQLGSGRVLGHRRGDKLTMSFELNSPVPGFASQRGGRTIDLPKDATLTDITVPFHGLGRLRQNKKWRFHTLDLSPPEGVSVTPMYALVEGRELRIVKGKDVEVWRVDVKKRPTEDTVCVAQAWVDDGGQVVEQRSYQGTLEIRSLLEEVRVLEKGEAAAWAWAPPEHP